MRRRPAQMGDVGVEIIHGLRQRRVGLRHHLPAGALDGGVVGLRRLHGHGIGCRCSGVRGGIGDIERGRPDLGLGGTGW